MTTHEIFQKASNSNYLIIDENDLQFILKDWKLVKEVDTILSDFIRLFNYQNNLFIQETTFKKEILLRKIESLEDADKFIQDRLDYYERKWDGCGCKIDYYE